MTKTYTIHVYILITNEHPVRQILLAINWTVCDFIRVNVLLKLKTQLSKEKSAGRLFSTVEISSLHKDAYKTDTEVSATTKHKAMFKTILDNIH